MAKLPADRTKLTVAQNNQVAGVVASASANINAVTEIYDTVDLLNSKVDGLVASGVLSPLPPDFFYRNAIINGNFDIWQRGTSFSIPTGTGNVYTADRWAIGRPVSGNTLTISRQEFSPGQTGVPGEPTYYMRIVRTGTASQELNLRQYIENVRTFAGQKVTLSFYAKAEAPHSANIGVFQQFGIGGSPSVTVTGTSYTISTQWQKFVFTFDIPSISGKTVGNFSSLEIRPIRVVDNGSTPFTIDIAQVQLCAGGVDLPFQQRQIGEEIILCRRYLYLLNNEQANSRVGYGVAVSTTRANIIIPLPKNMRTLPSLSISSVSDFQLSDGVSAIAVTGISLPTSVSSSNIVVLQVDVSGGLTQYRPYFLEFVGSGSKFLALDAEL